MLGNFRLWHIRLSMFQVTSWPFDFLMLACARVNVNRHSLTDENERKKTNLDERPVSDARVRAAWRSVLCYGFWIGIISTYIRLLSV